MVVCYDEDYVHHYNRSFAASICRRAVFMQKTGREAHFSRTVQADSRLDPEINSRKSCAGGAPAGDGCQTLSRDRCGRFLQRKQDQKNRKALRGACFILPSADLQCICRRGNCHLRRPDRAGTSLGPGADGFSAGKIGGWTGAADGYCRKTQAVFGCRAGAAV